jgi:hypothetical protein
VKFKDQIKKIFDENKEIVCPAFPKEKIFFNSKGINHLIYKGARSMREMSRIKTNIRLLPGAIKLLKIMPVSQEEACYENHGIKMRYWAFEGVIDGRRIKVVIRQKGNGNKHFFSVIPAWRKDRFGNVKNSKGDLREG